MSVTTEYELMRESAGLLDRSERGKVVLTGDEAAEFLQGQLTNDIEGLTPGTGCYATLLTHKGKIRADLRVLRAERWIWLDTEAIGLSALSRTIQMYSLGRDVRWEDQTASRAILSLLGPAARDAVDPAPPPTEHAFVEGELGLYVTTDAGVDVICDAGEAVTVREALGVRAVSEAAAECLRIESGRPRHGLDIGEDTIPQEAGLNDRAVSFTKGCYVGQETVARLHYKGKPNRRLLGLRLSAPVEHGDPITLGDREVGVIGSSCDSPVHGSIALAVVRREGTPGETVRVRPGSGVTGELVELPFVAS